MPRTAERGGPQTRARIREVANRLFLERGYDAVTVAEVAREAGVSSVTVFNHFPRKEDLFLDRTDDAVQAIRFSVRERAEGTNVLDALEAQSRQLFESRHPLSGVDERSAGFFRTVAGSPALMARAREILSELQTTLTEELDHDAAFDGDARLFATLFLAGYSSVLVETARRVVAGETMTGIVDDHGARLDRLFVGLRKGIASS
ncbi:MAG TPA: TetR/AcrR family transcriptional regulator [Galbitalea sp.]|jgi:AcrR family transcriptional regulator